MKTAPRVAVCCAALLALAAPARAQRDWSADPCGDPEVESHSSILLKGKVLRVVGGDAVVVSVGGRGVTRVNLLGVDAPDPGRPYAAPARRLLERLVGGRTVEIGATNRQAFGRLPAEIAGHLILRELGVYDVNLMLIQSGLARYKQAETYSMSNHSACHYVKAEAEARAARRGLWYDEP